MANPAVSRRRVRRFMNEVVRRISRASPLQGLLRRAVRRFVPSRWRTWTREEPRTPASSQESAQPSQGAQGAQMSQREGEQAPGVQASPAPEASRESQAPPETQASQGAQAPHAKEEPPESHAPWQADERTMRRVAEAEAGGISSQESAARYARGENPGGTHQKATGRPSEQMPHPRPSFEEPQERVERAPRGERRLPSTRRG